MLARVREPEVMNLPGEAAEYDAMDHSAVNQLFVADFLARLGDRAGTSFRALDLGTGTALIPIELCRNCERANVLAVDASPSMIKLARRNVEREGLQTRITMHLGDAKDRGLGDAQIDHVMHNSLVHHLHDPTPCLQLTFDLVPTGGEVFVRDLMRPGDEATLRDLVACYAADATDRQRALFADSLRAAFTVGEVQQMVGQVGGDPEAVNATSDRHWTWAQTRRRALDAGD